MFLNVSFFFLKLGRQKPKKEKIKQKLNME